MKNHMKYLRNEKGFTLIELLAVIVILGIIAAIAIPMIGNVVGKSQEKADVNEALNIIAAAKQKYAEDKGKESVTYKKADLSDYITVETKNDFEVSTQDGKVWTIKGHPGAEVVNSSNKQATETELQKWLKENSGSKKADQQGGSNS